MSRPLGPDTAPDGRAEPIGPGRLVLVVGPSGAGKDTLIGGARAACANDPAVVFPRRVVTRPASAAEDHDSVSAEDFARRVAAGAFALAWDAHGHRYGIPASIDDDIRSGRTVVCNVSRTVTGDARRRYARVAVVLVTAPPEILAERLAARARPDDGDLARRVTRSIGLNSGDDVDVVIRNVGHAAVGVRRLMDAIRDPGSF
jgi:ribose 1,5-bisphosphokinase